MDESALLLGDSVQPLRGAEAQPEAGLLPDVHGDVSEATQAPYTDICMASLGAFIDSLTEMREETRAKYVAELEHHGLPWRRPMDLRYAESLVFFGELERLVKNSRRRSRIWFRKRQECSRGLS